MPTLKECIKRLIDNHGPDAKFKLNTPDGPMEATLAHHLESVLDLDGYGIEFRQKNTLVWRDGIDRRVDLQKAAATCVMFNADLDLTPSIAARQPTLTWKPALDNAQTPVIPKLVEAFSGNEKCVLTIAELTSLLTMLAVFGMGRAVLPTADCVMRKLFTHADAKSSVHLSSDDVRDLIRGMAAFGAVSFAKAPVG